MKTNTVEVLNIAEVNRTPTTWKAFCAANSELTQSALQAEWRALSRVRQDSLKTQYDSPASGVVEYRKAGRISLSGAFAGTVKVAAVRRVTATIEQVRAQRCNDNESSAKRDGKYAAIESSLS